MTKEITKARIIQEIEDKFKLREFEPEVFTFSERVVPVYDVGSHLRKWECLEEEKSITSATYFLFFTVPDNERWTVSRYNVVFMAAGAYKVTGLYIARCPTFNTIPVYLDMVLGQTVSYAKELQTPVVLNPQDRLYMLVDDYTSTANLRLYIDCLKEAVR